MVEYCALDLISGNASDGDFEAKTTSKRQAAAAALKEHCQSRQGDAILCS